MSAPQCIGMHRSAGHPAGSVTVPGMPPAPHRSWFDQLETSLAAIPADARAEKIRSLAGDLQQQHPHIDGVFRLHVRMATRGRELELDLPRLQQRDLLQPALDLLRPADTSNPSFATHFVGAAVQAAPLLDLATTVTTNMGGTVDWSFVSTQPTVGGPFTPGTTVTASDPVWGGGDMLSPFKYGLTVAASNELIEDTDFPFEEWTAQRVAPAVARKASTDWWGGAGGTTAPEGLLAGLTTVTAAGAATVTLDDVANLLSNVPSEYAFTDRCAVLLAPAAYWQLRRQTLGTSAAGGMAISSDTPWNGRILGYRFRVDPALASPASAAKSVVAGDFSAAYVIRLLPLRVASAIGQTFNTDKTQIHVSMRVDGRRMLTNAARALVHP